MPIRVTALTHQGAVRPGNEDAIAVGGWVRSQPMPAPEPRTLDEVPAVCVVCDGMGGHAAGEVASRSVAEHLAARRAALTTPAAIAGAIGDAGAELFALMDQEPAIGGMGTTVAGVAIGASEVLVFNVGDSRVYGIRAGRLEQLSTDDTPGGKEADGRTALRRSSMITQVLGGHARRRLDVHVLVQPLAGWDGWLIASDGLTDLVPVDGIESCFSEDDDATVGALFEAAMAAGGDDNVSILLVRPAPAHQGGQA